ncbi:MAG: hypothetical protein KDE58_28670 [Caldilineaceae bacterium]|nr:hypothetical protein [Caldilineaceae bacterium]
MMNEADLYAPVKQFLEAQGYEVKGEVGKCDLVAMREDGPPLVVELKLSLNLSVLLQAVDRTAISDHVYIAIPEPTGGRHALLRKSRKSINRLFRMLGLGLITVGFRTPAGTEEAVARIEVVLEPGPYQPRKNLKRQKRLQHEFAARKGDFNQGGTTGRERMTAYRQDALLCADYLHAHGVSTPAAVKAATGIARARTILYDNVYGWFARPARGRYDLTAAGHQALTQYTAVLATLRPNDRQQDKN